MYPDDSFFEDTKVFEEDIMCMKLRHIPEERIVVLRKDPELERLEWHRQCFEAGPSEEKKDESKKGKEKEKTNDPTDKEKSLSKETNPLDLKDLEVSKEIPLGFDPKATTNPNFERQDLKDNRKLSAWDLEQTQKMGDESQVMIDPITLTPLSSRGSKPEAQEEVMSLSEYKFDHTQLVMVKITPKRKKALVRWIEKVVLEVFEEITLWDVSGPDVAQVGVENLAVITGMALTG